MFKTNTIAQTVRGLLTRPQIPSVAIALCGTLLASPGFAQLTANKAQVGTAEPITIDLMINQSRQDSLFFAAVVDNRHVFFFDEKGGVVQYQPGQVTPRRFAYSPQPGKLRVYSAQVPAGLTGKVTFYAGFGRHGGDLFAGSALDASTLQKVEVTVGPQLANGQVVGRVVDAAAAGAQVCLDVNRNRACDADEPGSTSAADGSFAFAAPASVAASHPILAMLPNGNLLEAPIGNYGVLSSLTTMVKHEQDVDPGVSLDRALRNVSLMFNLPESILLAAPVAGTPAAQVAATLSSVLVRETAAADLSAETDARRRAARVLYVRNMLSGGAPGNPATYPGAMIVNANAQTGADPVKAAALVTFPADAEKDNKIRMLAQQKFDLDVGIVDTRLEYLGQRTVALTYDATKNSLTFGITRLADGKVMKINPAAVSTAQVVAATSLNDVPLATEAANYSIQPDGRVRVVGKNGGTAVSEVLSTVGVVDLGGKTIPLAELLAWSKSTTSIPAQYNISVTFQPGDKLYREHHDKEWSAFTKQVFSELAKNVTSYTDYVKSHADLFSAVMTIGDYNVFFRPSAGNPLEGDLVGYNATTRTEVVVGKYYPRDEDGKQYLVLSAPLLKTYKVLSLEAGSLKSANWRDFVMTCICWQRKFNVAAAERIIAALKAADSPLIKSTTGTTPAAHAQLQGIPVVTSGSGASGFDPAAICGGCAGGNCGACPTGLLLGLR